ncbi:MAG: dienelactone hydrolase [Luteitalea sp.]|nr:dienelactone hydrolase [Luteitalea sp.]
MVSGGGWAYGVRTNEGVKPGQDVPWLAEVQRYDNPPSADTLALAPLLIDAQGQPIQSLSAWKEKRATIRERWLDFLGSLEPNPRRAALKVLEEDRPTAVVRQLVEYEGEPGIVVRGYLIKPQDIDEPRPGVLALHSTVDHTIRQPAGIQGVPEKAFGLKLAQLGFVTFSPENFLWHNKGERTYQEQVQRFKARHPGSKGMAKMLFDASRGLDVLASLGEVDPKRLGTIGHSLGGKEALYLAAFDRRVRVAVSSEGGIGTRFSNWEAPWYLSEAIGEFGHEHHELLALVAPRPFLLVGGNGADGEQSCPFIEAALPVYSLYGRPRRVGLLNHEQGHSVPPIAELRSYQWLLTYL